MQTPGVPITKMGLHQKMRKRQPGKNKWKSLNRITDNKWKSLNKWCDAFKSF